MTSTLVRSVIAIGAMAALAGFASAQTPLPRETSPRKAAAGPGTIVGVVRNADRAAVGGATVTANAIR